MVILNVHDNPKFEKERYLEARKTRNPRSPATDTAPVQHAKAVVKHVQK